MGSLNSGDNIRELLERVEGDGLLPLKLDSVFRRIFGEDPEALGAFVCAVLGVPEGGFAELEIIDPEIQADFLGDKFSRLDVRATAQSGEVYCIEIQLQLKKGFEERIVYNTAHLVTKQMTEGASYRIIKKTVMIVIADFPLVKGSGHYHHRYRLHDARSDTYFGDVMEIVTVELPKLPDESDGSRLWGWLAAIGAEDADKMERLAKGDPMIGKVTDRLRAISADGFERERAHERLISYMDRQSEFAYALEQGIEQGHIEDARRMKVDGMDVALICKYTGLTADAVAAL